jgi:GNAT superfamily N-acetyltransferase
MLETVLRIGLVHGEVWVTPPITGVAFWLSPEYPIVTEVDRDAAGWRAVGEAWGAEAFTRFRAFAADIGDVLASCVAESHWCLAWLCVDPGQQGQGIGSTLVRHMTARADRERLSCQLFTANLHNVPIYERLDFRVEQETILPRSGPRIWVMARQPEVETVG